MEQIKCKTPSVEVFVLSVVYIVSGSHLSFCNVNSVNVDYMIVFISGALLDSTRFIGQIRQPVNHLQIEILYMVFQRQLLPKILALKACNILRDIM